MGSLDQPLKWLYCVAGSTFAHAYGPLYQSMIAPPLKHNCGWFVPLLGF
jgi:hypothetical protein